MDHRGGGGRIHQIMTIPEFIPFGGAHLQAPSVEAADIVVLPICYENAASYGSGSLSGPLHLLNASFQLEEMDEECCKPWCSRPIHTVRPLFPSPSPEAAMREIEQAALSILKPHRFLLSLGGDHAITIGLVRAAAAVYGEIGVLQIDAHLDLRNTWNGSRYNHACVMRRIVDDMQIPAVSVGIRSFSPEEHAYVLLNRLSPVYAHTVTPGDGRWIDQVLAALPGTVYITLDLDGLDPSVIPGTGTPEPGGLTYRQVVDLIRAVGAQKRVVAVDINELSKIDGTQVSEFTAAKLATKFIIYACPQ